MADSLPGIMGAMRILTLACVAALLAGPVGCGTDDRASEGTESGTGSASPVDGATAAPGDYPHLAAEDYRYVLEMACFCPLTVPIAVTVEDGEVTSAVTTRDGPRLAKGEEVPEAGRLTINDVIDAANDTGADEVAVDWPAGQEWPDQVTVDPVEGARDDEVTYRITDVQVG
jgi:hypothetical protein